jgi:hypothetical protein
MSHGCQKQQLRWREPKVVWELIPNEWNNSKFASKTTPSLHWKLKRLSTCNQIFCPVKFYSMHFSLASHKQCEGKFQPWKLNSIESLATVRTLGEDAGRLQHGGLECDSRIRFLFYCLFVSQTRHLCSTHTQNRCHGLEGDVFVYEPIMTSDYDVNSTASSIINRKSTPR